MPLRRLARNLWIGTLTTLRADAWARRRAGRQPGPLVRVVLAHGTPRQSAEAFRKQLRWASRYFQFIDFDQFKKLWGSPPAAGEKTRPSVLFTFDDGLASNHDVAAPILEEFGTRGVFFVVPRFSLNPNADEARRYFQTQLKGTGNDFQPMTPHQVRELAERGHTIGNHTHSHARLSEVPPEQLRQEIIESAAVIESWISRPVEAFAWTFAWDAITPEAYKSACQRHPFCFTPCPGLVDVRTDRPQLLWRTNIEPDNPPSHYRFMYSGLVDKLWASKRAHLRVMLGSPPPPPSAP
jgi:peptidoglycan/xylan/chitin deacetylase (PgdA/CDA1 family)